MNNDLNSLNVILSQNKSLDERIEKYVSMIQKQGTPSDEFLENKQKEYIGHAKAENTKKAYSSDILQYVAWCEYYNVVSMPAVPDDVGKYITYLIVNGKKLNTINRRLSAISQWHQKHGHPSPSYSHEVRTLLQGIRGDASNENLVRVTQKTAMMTKDLRSIVECMDEDLKSIRNRAILLIGFAGALRRSEIVNIDVEHITYHEEGVQIFVPRSKTDQAGKGMNKAIVYGENAETCPVRSLQQWLRVSKIGTGPVFRQINRHGQVGKSRLTGQSVALIVKDSIASIGGNESLYSGHSLRAGLATQAAKNQASELDIMLQTGHKNLDILRQYIRRATMFDNNVSARLGL